MATTSYPRITNSRNADKFVVRLPDGLRQRIAEIATNRHYSMNTLVITTLIDLVNADEAAPSTSPPVAHSAPWIPMVGMLVIVGEAITTITGFHMYSGEAKLELEGFVQSFLPSEVRPYWVV